MPASTPDDHSPDADPRIHREDKQPSAKLPAGLDFLLLQQCVLDSMTEGVSVSDEQGYILYTNPAEDRMFGYERGELTGQHVTSQNAYSQEENATRVAAVIRALQTEGAWTGEWLNKKKDGTSFYTHARISSAELHGSKYWVCVQKDVTREKLSAAADVRLAAIVESSDDAIITKDLNGIITSWNKGAEKIFGYSAEEVLGKPISILAAPDRVNEIPNILERLRKGERINHYETFRRRKDGTIINVSLTVSPVRNSAGEIAGASKIARDITARTEMEERLATREQELRSLLGSLPDVVSRFGRDLRFCYISPSVEKATGAPPSHYIGKTHEEAGIPVSIAAQLEEGLHRIFKTGQESSIEFKLPRPDGDTRHYFGMGIPEFGADGQVKTVLTIVRDITERARAEQAQQAIERELLLLIEASGVLMTSPHSAKVAKTIIGLAQQFGGAHAYGVWRQQESPGTWRVVSSSGLSPQFTAVAMLSSEQKLPLFSDPVPVEDVQTSAMLSGRKDALDAEGIRSMLVIPLSIHGEVSGTVVFYWKERHRFSIPEIRIAKALGNLGAAALSAAELYERERKTQQALQVSNEELRRANEDLNQFAYSASHDLREPLRMVAIYTQLLERKYASRLDDKAREYIGFTLQGAKRMEMLVNDLLAYTQAAELGDQRLTTVNSDEMLELAVQNLKTSIDENGAEIIRSPLPELRMKEVHLMQLFQNLIGNAIKYRKPGVAPRIEVSAYEQERWSTIRVADNGIGIPAVYAKQIFGIFRRLHTSEEYSGTGIGLAICQRIVERYGGRIWVESEEGEGSRFFFTLPRGNIGTEIN